jgi:predicted HicB family RNase H-like nuclease
MKQAQSGEQVKVRLPTHVHEWIKSQAKEQDRSMNWIVNKMLESALAAAEHSKTAMQGARQ